MNTKIWRCLLLLLIIPGLLTTVACSKKATKTDTEMSQSGTTTGGGMDADAAAREAAERAKAEAKQRFENDDVYFEFDSAALSMEAQGVLKDKAQWLSDNPEAATTIEGHCDERGTNAYNMALGDRRATSAKNFLVNMGVAETRLSTVSFGEEKPVDPGHAEDAWAKNRRAHFVLP